MAILQKVQVVGAVSNEKVEGVQYTYTNGYGQMTKAGVTVQKGATAQADVNITMKAVTAEASQKWFDENKDVFSRSQQDTIKGHFDKQNSASGWNAIFAWGAKGSESQNYFQNADHQSENTTTAAQTKLVESASTLLDQKVQVTGTVSITGESMFSTTAFVFAQISTIQFADGTTISVINQSDPVAADSNGSTSGASAKPATLKVVPLK
jgi:hypothetical protein